MSYWTGRISRLSTWLAVVVGVGRVHAGDKLSGHDQASGDWRLVQLPSGIGGYLYESDVRSVVAPPPAPAVTQPGPARQVGPQTEHVAVLELAVAPNLAIGYQSGFQSTTDANGATADFKTRFLHLGAGFSLAL